MDESLEMPYVGYFTLERDQGHTSPGLERVMAGGTASVSSHVSTLHSSDLTFQDLLRNHVPRNCPPRGKNCVPGSQSHWITNCPIRCSVL